MTSHYFKIFHIDVKMFMTTVEKSQIREEFIEKFAKNFHEYTEI